MRTPTRNGSQIKAAMDQLANGSAAILTDSPDDPTFGEIVFAASRITTAATAFAIRHTSGFLQVALAGERCDHLLLPGQTGTYPASRQCVTVDASFGIGTGISAADRALTIRLLAAQDSSPDSFTRPGHVVPIRADMHHGQTSYGTPEAAIQIAMAAGLAPAAVIATIVSSDRPAEIAAGTELRRFARTHGLPLVGIGDIQWHFMPKGPTSDLRQQLHDLRYRPALARAHSVLAQSHG
jgi:3,4-dihydroxy-2-butanone 4-phosphate synthase